MMGPWTNEALEVPVEVVVDQSLARPVVPDIAIDQLMRAVEGVRPYVKSHLARYGFIQDMNDVLQEIRVAAWDGTVRGIYHAVPGVKFDAWVQGIASNLCADHIRRTLSRPALPLLDACESGFRRLADVNLTQLDNQVANRMWATDILLFVKSHVQEATWELAIACLEGRHRGETCDRDPGARKRWQAVSVVRQMALTVRNAMDVEPHRLVDAAARRTAVVASLPSPLYRIIAERVVLPGVRGELRQTAIEGIAHDVGISIRYIEVQVGTVRNLVHAAEDVLQAGTTSKVPAAETVTPRLTVAVVDA
ncbi:sigma factor [Arthrobacter sp. STN4]|uniref:sigma factor n=1 Tax=Arthrobacter sp. STN4 TaxID=2923276 RepID=UPI00211A4F64|nr:sigma factor [Arthrobacter sp. STN4]MCQ9163933.1 hypothetical protein [Arthrobacter sp. STN4]